MKIIGAFVGRSFNTNDESLWAEIQKNFNSLKRVGFVWEDAEEGQARPISDKVKERIDRNDIFIGILTKREPICRPIFSFGRYNISQVSNWVTSYWVIQESGYAIGKGKKVLFLIEKGLSVPQGLNADYEYVEIDRLNPSLAFTKINEIINTEIGKKLIPAEEHVLGKTTELSLPQPSEKQKEEDKGKEEDKSVLPDEFFQMLSSIREKDYITAEKLFNSLIEKAGDNEKFQRSYHVIYFSELYKSGKSESLTNLKQFVEHNPSYYYGIDTLTQCYLFYDDFNNAEMAVKDYLSRTTDDELQLNLSILLSGILLKQKKIPEATIAISSFFQRIESFAKDKGFELYKLLADIYVAKGQEDIACSLYDMALNYSPTNHSVRFDTAYKYSAISKRLMSLYHYKTHLKAQDDDSATNNLGVEYGALKLMGKSISMYKKAVDSGNTLSNANIARIYIENGFFEEAKDILDKATQKKEYHRNVNYFLSNLDEAIEREKKEEETLLEVAKEYRKYILEYATAIATETDIYTNINGDWVADRKDINEFTIAFQQPDKLTGTHKSEYTVKVGLGALGVLPVQADEKHIREVSISGSIINRGIKWTFKVKKYPSERYYLGSTDLEISGFAILSKDANQISFITEKDNSFEVFRAFKK